MSYSKVHWWTEQNVTTESPKREKSVYSRYETHFFFPFIPQARRQQRKLNFLITQTELYAHFMARKMTGETEARRDAILNQLNDGTATGLGQRQVDGGVLVDDTVDSYSELMHVL